MRGFTSYHLCAMRLVFLVAQRNRFGSGSILLAFLALMGLSGFLRRTDKMVDITPMAFHQRTLLLDTDAETADKTILRGIL
jgi:hypothetical protein